MKLEIFLLILLQISCEKSRSHSRSKCPKLAIENFEKNKPICSQQIEQYSSCVQHKFCEECLKTPGCGWCLNKCLPGDKSSASCKQGQFSCILDNWSFTLGSCYFKNNHLTNQIGIQNQVAKQIEDQHQKNLNQKYLKEFEEWKNRY